MGVYIMEKEESRPVINLSPDLTAAIDAQQRVARKYLPNEIQQAVISIHAAWKMLPVPKYNNSSSVSLLRDCIYILNFALKHDEAKQLLERWVADMEGSGYKIEEALPYLLLGETLLLLEQPDAALTQFQKAFAIGGQNAFAGYLALYLDIATEKITGSKEIQQAFEKEDLLEVWFAKEETTSARHTMSADMAERIEEICEEGGE